MHQKKSLEKHMKVFEESLNLYLEKWILVLMIRVNHQQKRKMNMKCVDIHCLLTIHSIKKKLDYYRGKDSLKRFCQDLKKQAKSIIDFEKKELPVLTIDEEFKHHMAPKCYICEKKFYNDKKNNCIKVRDHCHYTGKYGGAAHKICNLMYNTPREIPVVFHNGSSYDYHFIMD